MEEDAAERGGIAVVVRPGDARAWEDVDYRQLAAVLDSGGFTPME